MICGIVEFSRLYYVRLTVRDITQEATRFAVTGQQLTDPTTGKPMPRAASILGVIRKSAEDRRVTVDSAKINPSDGGQPGEVVQVRVFYNYKFTLAPLRTLLPTTPFYFSVGSSMTSSQPHGKAYYAPSGAELQAIFSRVAMDIMVHLVR